MKKFVLLICAFLLIFSCTKKKNEEIYGNWYFDKVIEIGTTKDKLPLRILEMEIAPAYNFEIKNDSVIDWKNGFYYQINNKIWNATERHHNARSSYYLGSETEYIKTNSEIRFFNKHSKKWDTLTIIKKSQDTLLIKGYQKAIFRLINKKNNYFNKTKYDAISVSRSPCYGSCPFNLTYLDRNGNFNFKAFDSNTITDNVSGKLTQKQIDYYFGLFDKIPLEQLKNQYSIEQTDSQSNIISFLKKGKIIKTICCYSNPPIDLVKAYKTLSFAYQQVTIDSDYDYLFKNNVSFYSFKNNSTEYQLKDAESFFIEIALKKGIKTTKTFNKTFKLVFSDWQRELKNEEYGEVLVKNIDTDGRYYQINFENNTSKTIDIGYNFIDKNPIIKQNRNQ